MRKAWPGMKLFKLTTVMMIQVAIFIGANAESFFSDNMCATADVRNLYGGGSYTISSSVYDIDKVFDSLQVAGSVLNQELELEVHFWYITNPWTCSIQTYRQFFGEI